MSPSEKVGKKVLYCGESCRSLKERLNEHRDLGKKEESHMKHMPTVVMRERQTLEQRSIEIIGAVL